MTVPKSEFSDSLTPQGNPNARQAEILDCLRAGPRTLKELSSSLQREQGAVKAVLQSLVKLRICEELHGGKGCSRFRLRRPEGGSGGGALTAPGGMISGMPVPPFTQGMMGYSYPYGQQMYYYMPVPYPAVGAGGKTLPGGAGEGASGSQHAVLPFPYPPPTPYTNPLRTPGGHLAGPGRRPAAVSGWGGVPLSSAASPPGGAFMPPHHLGATGVSVRGVGTPRSTGAARTVPLPPRKASGSLPDSISGSASAGLPPRSPAQVDMPSRSALAASTTGSEASSEAESAGRSASTTSSGMDVPGAAAPAAEQQQTEAGAPSQQGEGGEKEDGVAGSRGEGQAEEEQQQQPGGGSDSQQWQQQRGGQRGQQERQACAFFLKTGTCAYGDRCKFEHPYDLAPHVEFNSLGLPLRPSEPECAYYVKYKTCGFGHTCKFHHPELEEVEIASAAAAGSAVGGPATPFAAMQYIQYGGGFPMAFGPYSGAHMQGQLGPGFMPGPPPPGAIFMSPHASQPLPPPALPVPPPPAQAPAAHKQQGRPAVLEAPSPAVPLPVPVPGGPGKQQGPAREQAAEQKVVGSPVGNGGSTIPMSPPRPLMVFGKSKPAAAAVAAESGREGGSD